jgi:hypothetical protein
MALDIEKARAAGYSDADIVDYLAKDSTLDINKARAAGYDDAALLKHLSTPKQEAPKPATPPVATGPKGKNTTQLPDDDETGDFMRGIYNYLPQLQETYGGAKVFTGMGLKKLGATETGQSLIESGKESMDIGESKQVTRESDSLTRAWEKGIGSVVTEWLPYNIGSGIANVGETLAVMGIGAGVGALTGAGAGAIPGAISAAVSKTLVKKGIVEAAENIIETEAKKALAEGATKQAAKVAGEAAGAKFIETQSKNVLLAASETAAKAYGKAGAKAYGATAGMVGQAGLHGTGETTSRAVNEAERAGMDVEDIEYGRLATAAAVHSVADFFINKIGVNALKIGEQATKSLTLDIAKRIATTGLKEIPAEEIQTMAERYGAKLSLTDAEALREYVDTAGAAFAMSVGPGTVGGAKTHYVNKLQKAGAEAEAAGKTYRGDLTVNKDVIPPTIKGFDKESANLLMPATDAAGNPIVADVAAPEVTETTPAPKKTRAPKITAEGVTPESIQAANDYVGKIDSGETIKQSEYRQIARAVGLSIPVGTKNSEAVELIRNHLAQQGAPDATGINTQAGGAGAGVATLANQSQTAAGAAGSQPGGVVSTGTNAGANLAGAKQQPFTLISPVTQRIIADEHNEGATPAELITKYGNSPEVAAAIDQYIKTLPPAGETLGTETTETKQTKAEGKQPPSTLSAKRPTTVKGWLQHFLKTGETDPKLAAIQQDSHPAFVADPNATPEQNAKDAMELGQRYEAEAEAERTRLLNESTDNGALKKEDIYARYDAEQERKQTEAEAKFGLEPTKAGSISQENRDNYDKAREEFPELPEWSDLSAVDKDVYFENVRYGNMPEHRKAAQALINYRKETGGRGKGYGQGTTTVGEQRTIKNYEDNRNTASKMFNVSFPRWGDLSRAVQQAYLSQIVNNAGLQQDVAFAKAGEALLKENRELSDDQKKAELANINKRQEEVRKEAEQNKEELEKLRRTYGDVASTSLGRGTLQLSKSVIEHLQKGRLGLALQDVSDTLKKNSDSRNKMFGYVANLLGNLGLKTKIEFIDRLPDGDLGIYDPYTDTITLSLSGLTVPTLLHEVAHAATVRVMYMYMNGQKNQLTERQIKGVEQILTIMRQTQFELQGDYPEAFTSPFEFIAYAMTDKFFQADLAEQGIDYAEFSALDIAAKLKLGTEDIFTILPTEKSQWSAFKKAMAGIFKVPAGALKSPNFMVELSGAFEDILSVPTEPINLETLSAKKPKGQQPAVPKTAESRETGLYEKDKNYEPSNKEKYGVDTAGDLSRLGKIKRAFSRHGWRDFVTKAQSRRQHIRAYENELNMAGLLNRDPTGAFNNVSEKQDLALNQGVRFAIDYLQQPLQKLHDTFNNWLLTSNQNTEKGLDQFHRLAEMFGATERRFAKWITSVPLSKTQNLTHNGKPISAAERRIQLMGDPRTGVDGLIHKVALNDQQKAAIRKELEYLATNHADALGDSPRISEKMRQRFAKNPKHKGIDTDKNAPIYNALGIEEATVNKRMTEFLAKSKEEQALIKEMFDQVKIITDATAELNKIGNYWSMPVSNIVGIYNYQYYMPFKGLSKHTKVDDMIDPNSKMNGAEMQDEIHAAEGRFSTSDNPLLQMIYDGYRAASRAGRKDFTQSVENAVEPTTSKDAYNPTGTGVIPGRVVKTVPFWERETVDLSKYKGANSKYIFNYKADGSMNIIAIDNPKLLQAIRYPFREKTPLWDAANRITGFFGSMHTRFNYNFAPKDFVVNTLTNAWNAATSEKIGPLGAAAYLKDVAMAVTKNGLGKAMNIAVLEEIGSAGSKKIMSDMAAKDPFIRDMLEMIRYGGKSTYMESFSLKSNLETLSENSFGKNNIITDPISATKLLDSWNNMFEFTSRTAMYSLYKERALKQNIAGGMSDKKGPNGELSPAERAAAEEAAAFTLNLANFSQQGEWGKVMGAFYMFSKPSATGAVRALESVLPAFTSVKRAMQDLPPVIENNPTAKAKYEETFRIRKRNASFMTGSLIAMGGGLFALSMMGAPDDEWERNAALTDNMEQWSRYARFHIPNEVSERLGLGKDVVFQIPWGFGPGAFAASGAQFAAMLAGTITPLEAASNIAFTIMTDAFLPLPMSKIPFVDNKVMWVLDSVAPTVIRPFIEWVANINGVGQAINSASQRRMGDAYTGGDRIPEIYKDVADGLYESTHGAFDISPNTMYFFTNSYLDGVAKIAELMYSWTNLGKGEKEFNPKTDLPLFGSFFGAKTNVDSREYGKIEQKIKEIDKRLVTLDKRNPALYAEFVAENPLYPSIVEQYQSAQGELNEMRQRATEIRNNKYLAIKDRDALLKLVILEQNMLKYRLVQDFKAMGLER